MIKYRLTLIPDFNVIGFIDDSSSFRIRIVEYEGKRQYEMIYGKRRFSQYFNTQLNQLSESIKRSFQVKATSYLSTVLLGASLIIFLPVIYYLNQNYQFFIRLSYDVSPLIVENLEHEITWLISYIFVGIVFLLGITFHLTTRFTSKVSDPLVALNTHMRELMMGQLDIPTIDHTKYDDFKIVLMTYSTLHQYLIEQNKMEIDLLKKIQVDQQRKESLIAYKELLLLKGAYLEKYHSENAIPDVINETGQQINKHIDHEKTKSTSGDEAA